jgi:hypothetical protein
LSVHVKYPSEKRGKDSGINIRMFWFKKNYMHIHTNINEFKYAASLLGKKELNQNAECSQKRNWVEIRSELEHSHWKSHRHFAHETRV